MERTNRHSKFNLGKNQPSLYTICLKQSNFQRERTNVLSPEQCLSTIHQSLFLLPLPILDTSHDGKVQLGQINTKIKPLCCALETNICQIYFNS